jgi:sulfoxide reductase catalytic subunit YedY
MSQNKRFELPAKEITPKDVYMNRRQFLRGLGTASAGTMGLISGCNSETIASRDLGGTLVNLKVLKPERNQIYTLDRPMTEEREAAKYTNFYEFSSGKSVWKYVERFMTSPWQVEISGLVNNPHTLDVDDLVKKMPLEERAYRHRCVEAWAMAVLWTGFPFKELIKRADPNS